MLSQSDWHDSVFDGAHEPDTREPSVPNNFTRYATKVLLAVFCVIFAVFLLNMAGVLVSKVGYIHVFLSGDAIQSLAEGSLVAIHRQKVGRVSEFTRRDGEMVAHLLIEKRFSDQITSDSDFSVTSLNDWFPGKVGVRIQPANGKPIADGAVVHGSSAFLSVSVPPRFYLLVSVGAALTVGLVYFSRKYRSFKAFIVGLGCLISIALKIFSSVS